MICTQNHMDMNNFLMSSWDFSVDMVDTSVDILVDLWNEEITSAVERIIPRNPL